MNIKDTWGSSFGNGIIWPASLTSILNAPNNIYSILLESSVENRELLCISSLSKYKDGNHGNIPFDRKGIITMEF